MIRHRSILMLMLAGVIWLDARDLFAQIPGPLLPSKAVEIGAKYERVHRDVEYEDEKEEFKSSGGVLCFRLGLTETLTASAEVGGAMGSSAGSDLTYIVGAHIQTRMWSHEAMAVTTSISYKRTLNVAGTAPGPDIDEHRLEWNVLVQQPVSIRTQEITLWAGPAISYLYATPQSPFPEESRESSNLLGGIAGVGAVLMHHVFVNAQATWIDRVEPTVSLGYRF